MRAGVVLRDLEFQDGRFFDKKFFGYGGGGSAWVKPGWFGWEKDQISFIAAAGNGIGRWISGTDSSGLDTNYGRFPITTAAQAGNVIVKPVAAFGGTIAYEHYWLPNLRSDIDVGIRHFEYDSNLIGPNQDIVANKQLVVAHANVMWSPLPFTDFGVEYIYGQRRVVANLRGNLQGILTRFRMRF
jgi:hypothetical protein